MSSLGKILTNLLVTQIESGDIALKMDMYCCSLFAAWGREEEVTNTRSSVKFWSCGKPLRLLNSQKGKTLSISQQWIHQRCPALLIFHCAALGQCKNIRVEIYCAILWQTEIPGSSALASSDLLSVGLHVCLHFLNDWCVRYLWLDCPELGCFLHTQLFCVFFFFVHLLLLLSTLPGAGTKI